MLSGFSDTLAKIVSSRKGSLIIICLWLVAVVVLSAIAPAAKQTAQSTQEASIYSNMPAEVAKLLQEKSFPSDDGLPALIVFYQPDGLNADQEDTVREISRWLASNEKPDKVSSSLPFHQFPENVQQQFYSENPAAIMLNLSLTKELESSDIHQVLDQIRQYIDQLDLNGMQVEITGPAGIASDTIALFSQADLVLMFATVGLILILLIIIYRSPLLAIIPLVIAGIVYQVTDRLIGLAAQNQPILADKQALSIMMILLFAVLTDYCLFILSRYREELGKLGSPRDAMQVTMSRLSEPILFSGSTILAAMLTLFLAVFQAYHYFAPVFAIATVVILLGGLTLIPAVFTLFGRKAFWPFIPKLGVNKKSNRSYWQLIGHFVTKQPAVIATIMLVLLLSATASAFQMKFSFNLLNSFPKELSSRQGFNILEENFAKGKLAPVTVLLESNGEINMDEEFVNKLSQLYDEVLNHNGVSELTPAISAKFSEPEAVLPRNFLSVDKHVLKFQLTLSDHPYEEQALETVRQLRSQSNSLLKEQGIDPASFTLHYAGQTAQQLDVLEMNSRDTIIIFSVITIIIAIMLIFQARSIAVALMMMVTMLLSYGAALGISWLIFNGIFQYDAVSYRLPVYSFVFLIALGVDYNIMLVSRIREEKKQHAWKDAIAKAVAKTGGVISSAGIILAATFLVLMTQPLQELFLFGFIMALGILLDTFVIRAMLLPALLAWLLKR